MLSAISGDYSRYHLRVVKSRVSGFRSKRQFQHFTVGVSYHRLFKNCSGLNLGKRFNFNCNCLWEKKNMRILPGKVVVVVIGGRKKVVERLKCLPHIQFCLQLRLVEK